MKLRWGIIVCFLVLCSSCSTEIVGEGGTETQTYSITTGVTKVSVDHEINTLIKYGSSKKVHITGYSNLLQYVKVSATGGVIKIGMDPDYTYQNMNVTAVVETPALTGVTTTHLGNVEIDTFSNTLTTLEITTNSSANITCTKHINIESLVVNVNSSGSVYLKGSGKTMNASTMGNGKLKAFDMIVKTANIIHSAPDTVQVNSLVNLNATINSSGNIYYKGYPSINTIGSGTGIVIDAN